MGVSSSVFIFDTISLIGLIILSVSAILALIVSYNYAINRNYRWGEFLSLMIFAVFGGAVMISGANFISIYIGLETLSLSAYVLAGYNKDVRSCEAAAKYFVLGSVASAILLFGIAFFYGAAGTLEITNVQTVTTNSKILLKRLSVLNLIFKAVFGK